MDDWFSVERIDPETYAISEYKHPEETNCYLLSGRERALLIDTGLGVSDIRRAVDALTDLPVTATATHVHWDHVGGHGLFDTVAVHEAEAGWLSGGFPLSMDEIRRQLTARPFVFPASFDLAGYRVFQGCPQIVFRDGERFDLGGRTVVALHTPGHSPGHCCFWEPERKWVYSGDLLYAGQLDAFYPSTDPSAFYESVKRIAALGANRLLPGHHRLDLPADFARAVERAFSEIEERGLLKHGSGVFSFGDFGIKL